MPPAREQAQLGTRVHGLAAVHLAAGRGPPCSLGAAERAARTGQRRGSLATEL